MSRLRGNEIHLTVDVTQRLDKFNEQLLNTFFLMHIQTASDKLHKSATALYTYKIINKRNVICNKVRLFGGGDENGYSNQ